MSDTLLELLTYRFRLVAQAQAEGIVSASTVGRLLRSGMLAVERRLVYWPPLSLPKPLAVWKPGDPHERAGAVSYRCIRRWRGMSTKVVPVLTATEKAARVTGGVAPGIASSLQVTHDMHLWQIYKGLPEEMQARWLSEDICRSHGWLRSAGKLPDAVITEPKIAVEFGGSYGPARVKEFQSYCELEGLPYGIW